MFRTYVWGDKGIWRVRVDKSKNHTQARRAIRTALVARDLAEPGEPIAISRELDGDDFREYRTKDRYRVNRLRRSRLGPIGIGSHVLILDNDHFPRHSLRVGAVGLVTDRYDQYDQQDLENEMWRVQAPFGRVPTPLTTIQIVNVLDMRATTSPLDFGLA
jgi:hypothetical protein